MRLYFWALALCAAVRCCCERYDVGVWRVDRERVVVRERLDKHVLVVAMVCVFLCLERHSGFWIIQLGWLIGFRKMDAKIAEKMSEVSAAVRRWLLLIP